MEIKPKIKDETTPMNFSLSLSLTPSPTPPISTSTPLYLSTQIAPVNPSCTIPNNVGWITNHPNHVLNDVGMNSISYCNSSSNQTKNLTKPDLHLAQYPNLSETYINRNPLFCFDSDTNQNKNKNKNKIHSILQLGSEKTHEPSRFNSVVSPLSSPTHWFNNNISSNSNRVEKNETSRFGLTLNKNLLEPVSMNELVQVDLIKGKMVLVEPQSKDKLVLVQPVTKEPDEPSEKKPKQLDLIRKGKSKVEVRSPLKVKGSSEINYVAGEKEEEEEVEIERLDEDKMSIAEILKSWNLRPRKSMTNPDAKLNNGRSRLGMTSARVIKPQSVKSHSRPSSKRSVVKEKQRFEFTLTKEEIEHDFMQMAEEKPPKKPLKRPNIVQKNLDVLFPGMYLTNVKPEKYTVNENPPPLKC